LQKEISRGGNDRKGREAEKSPCFGKGEASDREKDGLVLIWHREGGLVGTHDGKKASNKEKGKKGFDRPLKETLKNTQESTKELDHS